MLELRADRNPFPNALVRESAAGTRPGLLGAGVVALAVFNIFVGLRLYSRAAVREPLAASDSAAEKL